MIPYSQLEKFDLDQKTCEQIRTWVEEFLCQPHSALIEVGRSSEVCPMLPPAVNSDRLYIDILDLDIPLDQNKREYLGKEILKIGNNFIENTDTTEGSIDCLLVVLQNLHKHEWRYVLDGARLDVKPTFLKNKLMIGAFYPTSNRTSRMRKDFFPLRSPVAMIGIRHLIRIDWRTLDEDPLYIEIYESFYGKRDESPS